MALLAVGAATLVTAVSPGFAGGAAGGRIIDSAGIEWLLPTASATALFGAAAFVVLGLTTAVKKDRARESFAPEALDSKP